MGDATRSEKRAANKKIRSAGKQAARTAGSEEMFRRSQPMALAASTDPQLTLRQQVAMNKEAKGGGTSATPGGNKSDPQLKNREEIDVRNEDKACGCKGCGAKGESYTTYAGEHGKCPECGARPDIVVRHEGLDLDDDTKDKFSKKKSPVKGGKLFMFSLIMGKNGKKGKDKASISETRSRLNLVRASGRSPRLTNLATIRSRARNIR